MMRYRPEIDGLRTVAILPVVLFHAGITSFSGGYVGVDIFFVISGYLITGIIHREIGEGRFSIVRFYERRIRRIFPALIAMLVAVAVAASLYDLPSELRELPRYLAGAVLFSSNIVIWRHSGYFDAPSGSNPLLHTWSLGVEEQFYIAMPIFLLLVMRYFPRYLKPLLVLCAFASLVLCVVATPVKPHASFFLVPMRAWELLAGALIATGSVPLPRQPIIREILSWAGFVMIALSIALFTPKTSFPGYAAILPVLGAALLVATSQGTSAAKLLSLPPAIFIGRISYSLYLWHWPIIVFGRQLGLLTGDLSSVVLACLTSFAAAIFSWRVIEQPFRGNRIPAPRIFASAGICAAAMLTATIGLRASNGWASRFTPQAISFDKASHDISPKRDACHADHGLPKVSSSCIIGGKTASIALWGDSHGVELSYAFGTLYRPVMSITYSSCPPALGYRSLSRPDCTKHNDQVFDFLTKDQSIKTVILTAYYVDIVRPSFDEQFTRTVHGLQAAGKEVIVVGPFPSPGVDVPKALARGWGEFFTRKEYLERYAGTIAFLSGLQHEGVAVLWPAKYLCDDEKCHIEENGRPVFFDRHHPSLSGARFFVEHFMHDQRKRQLLATAGN
jgi:peptidoglycan/LPS O-acetylase OafA/YrhL